MAPFATVITRNAVSILRDPSSTIWTKIWHGFSGGEGGGNERWRSYQGLSSSKTSEKGGHGVLGGGPSLSGVIKHFKNRGK